MCQSSKDLYEIWHANVNFAASDFVVKFLTCNRKVTDLNIWLQFSNISDLYKIYIFSSKSKYGAILLCNKCNFSNLNLVIRTTCLD